MAPSAQTMLASLGPQRLGRYAEWFAVAVAVALPWSTTLTGVFITLWLVTLIPSLDVLEMRFKPWIPVGGLPIPMALWTLAVVGMLWAHAPLAERIAGLNSFHKLLAIPLLIFQFRETDGGIRVLIGFLVSCTVMLIFSWGLVLLPDLPWRTRYIGVPVKDYISQSTVFTLCIFGLAEGALLAWRKACRTLAVAIVLLAIVFLANILYVATSRTAFVAVPILLMLFAFMRLGWKSAAALFVAVTMLVATAWTTSPQLRDALRVCSRRHTAISRVPILPLWSTGWNSGANPSLSSPTRRFSATVPDRSANSSANRRSGRLASLRSHRPIHTIRSLRLLSSWDSSAPWFY